MVPTLLTHHLVFVATFLALSFFFLELTNAVLWAIPMDIAPQHAGTAGGLMNTGFGVAGVLSPLVFGMLLDATGSWTVPFAVSAALLFIGAVAALRVNPQPISVETVAVCNSVTAVGLRGVTAGEHFGPDVCRSRFGPDDGCGRGLGPPDRRGSQNRPRPATCR